MLVRILNYHIITVLFLLNGSPPRRYCEYLSKFHTKKTFFLHHVVNVGNIIEKCLTTLPYFQDMGLLSGARNSCIPIQRAPDQIFPVAFQTTFFYSPSITSGQFCFGNATHFRRWSRFFECTCPISNILGALIGIIFYSLHT